MSFSDNIEGNGGCSADDIEDNSECPADDRITKKVRFKDKGMDNVNMSIDPELIPTISWKDMLLGNFVDSTKDSGDSAGVAFDFVGDFTKSLINGIPAISFSDRVQNFLLKDMETTVVVKL